MHALSAAARDAYTASQAEHTLRHKQNMTYS